MEELRAIVTVLGWGYDEQQQRVLEERQRDTLLQRDVLYQQQDVLIKRHGDLLLLRNAFICFFVFFVFFEFFNKISRS